ncbi:MAG: excinuclease ABC subunit UvrC [Alistipes sp.]|nr:excinuclease ABC subunit UvrC [Alistipes sp.]MDE6862134.1 excinuclease ABC subunit UvrC [Alistipes sp.]MDE7130044.1 excinuclease ABC subunit UvrC [Alistipes sp.]
MNHSDDILQSLKRQVEMLPLSPGVYQFVDKNGTIIYVGKAKSLRRRVSSYFVQSRDHSAKVRVMVKQIVEIRHIVVGSEQDALLLENSLIKSLQPRYNILLKDDKTYPWIVVRKEPFPRVQSTRRLVRDGSQYYGPYGSISAQHALLEFIREVIPLRTCKLNLSPSAIARGRYSVCLQYHLGNCKAPCIGAQSEQEYAQSISLVQSILKGDLRPVRRHIEQEMMRAAEELRFEAAQRCKSRLAALDNYQSRSVIVSARIVDCDVFSLLVDDDVAYCNFLRLRHGSIVAVQTVRMSTGVDTADEDLLSAAISHIVETIAGELSREVIVPVMPTAALLFDGVTFTIPKRGEKAELLEFSLKSARIYRAEAMKNLEIKNPERHTERLMNAMQKELHLSHQPRHIECFDNSNLQGTNPVASCVVFRDGKPSRKEYRHFNIKEVVGIDDFASMREIVRRRYSRLLDEGAELPDLIIVDGGKGQLSSAYGVLCELGIAGRVPIVGLAKRIEEIFFPDDPMPYYLSRTGEPLKVVCHIRDEAHRFGITFHRQKRSKAFIDSELSHIPGIGEKSVTALMRHFRTLSAVRAASEQQLAEVVGAAKARAIIEYFS